MISPIASFQVSIFIESGLFCKCLHVIDVTHDIMEGIAEEAINRILTFAKNYHGLTEDSINEAIKVFINLADPLEKYNTLPIANVKYSSTLKSLVHSGTAAQTRSLLSHLPFIFHFVNGFKRSVFYSSKQFKCFTLIVKISSYVYSPCLFTSDVHDMKLLISKFLKLTVEIDSNVSDLTIIQSSNPSCKQLESVKRIIKPKGHNLCHYANMSLENGPLRYFE